MNIFEIIDNFEIGNSEKNKYVAVLIRNSEIYYKKGFKLASIKLYGFERSSAIVEELIKIIINSDDSDLVNIAIKTLQQTNSNSELNNAIKRNYGL